MWRPTSLKLKQASNGRDISHRYIENGYFDRSSTSFNHGFVVIFLFALKAFDF